MLKVSVDIINPDIGRTFRSKLRAMTGDIDKAVRYSALKIYNAARDKCPVDTGNLRGSITIKNLYEGPETAAFVYSNVEYAEENEYSEKPHPITYHPDGTERQKNPSATWGFFRKSLAEEEPAFKSRIEGILRS